MFENNNEKFKDYDVWESCSHWGMFKVCDIWWTARLVINKEVTENA